MEPRAITLGDEERLAELEEGVEASMEPRAITLGDRDPFRSTRLRLWRFNGAEGDHPRRLAGRAFASTETRAMLQWSRGRSPSEMVSTTLAGSPRSFCFNGAEGDHPRRFAHQGDSMSPALRLQWSRGRSPSEMHSHLRGRDAHLAASMEPRAITLGDGGGPVGNCQPQTQSFNGAEGDHPRRFARTDPPAPTRRCFNGAEGDHPRRLLATANR